MVESVLSDSKNVSLNFGQVNWWYFTIALGVALLVLGIWKKTWIGFWVWLVAVVAFTLLEGFIHDKKVVRGAHVSHASNWKIHFDFSKVNWWVFEVVLFAIFLIVGLTKKRWQPAIVMIALALMFGLYYGLK